MKESIPTRKKIAFALLPVLIGLFIGEVATRVFGADKCGPIQPQAGNWETMIGDRDLLWKLEPNTVFRSEHDVTRINEVGLRDSLSPSEKKQSNEKRILITGDSSIYGWGVKDTETLAVQLERELNGRDNIGGPSIKVINMGVPGYSTEQTIRLLDKVGWLYEPDLVIVSNIFSDCNIDAFQDKTALALANPQPGFWMRQLQRSRLYCACHMTWVKHQAGLNQDTNRVLMPGIPTGPNAAVALEKINASIALSRVPIPDYLGNLGTIKAAAEKRGSSMLLAPLAQEWDVGIWRVPMDKPDKDHVLPWFPYRDAQKKWAGENKVGIVDFPSVFASQKGDLQRLFVDNMHPSREGHQIMARALANHIKGHPELLGLSTSRPGRNRKP